MKHRIHGVVFDITLDAKNRIFQLQSSDSESQSYCESLLNREIDEAIQYLSQNILPEAYLAGWRTLLALKSARGDKVLFYENPKRDQLICRCMGFSLTDLASLKERKDLKAFMRDTSVGMVCSTCRPTLQAVFNRFEEENLLIEGKTLQDWREIVWALLPEYQLYSGEDISKNVVGIDLIEFPKLKLVVDESFEILMSDKKDAIENRVSNFLSQKLRLAVNVKLAAFGDSTT